MICWLPVGTREVHCECDLTGQHAPAELVSRMRHEGSCVRLKSDITFLWRGKKGGRIQYSNTAESQLARAWPCLYCLKYRWPFSPHQTVVSAVTLLMYDLIMVNQNLPLWVRRARLTKSPVLVTCTQYSLRTSKLKFGSPSDSTTIFSINHQ